MHRICLYLSSEHMVAHGLLFKRFCNFVISNDYACQRHLQDVALSLVGGVIIVQHQMNNFSAIL